MQRVWRPQAERHEANTEDAEHAGEPAHRHDTGDDRRRSQHNADLERGRGEFILVIARQWELALLLGLFRAFGEFLAAVIFSGSSL